MHQVLAIHRTHHHAPRFHPLGKFFLQSSDFLLKFQATFLVTLDWPTGDDVSPVSARPRLDRHAHDEDVLAAAQPSGAQRLQFQEIAESASSDVVAFLHPEQLLLDLAENLHLK